MLMPFTRAASLEGTMSPLIFPAVVTYFVILPSITSCSEETTSFSCCPSPRIWFDQRCEHQWIIDGMTIGRFKGEKKGFIAPIKEVKDDLMMLDQCVDLNVTITCENNGMVVEERIRYRGEPCPTPISGNTAPWNQGCVPLLLLAALILVLLL